VAAVREPARYIAVDIAGPEIESALARMAPDYPEIEMLGVVTDFSRGVSLEGVLDARAGDVSSIRGRASATSRPRRRYVSWYRSSATAPAPDAGC
jgi:hypothetical protein